MILVEFSNALAISIIWQLSRMIYHAFRRFINEYEREDKVQKTGIKMAL